MLTSTPALALTAERLERSSFAPCQVWEAEGSRSMRALREDLQYHVMHHYESSEQRTPPKRGPLWCTDSPGCGYGAAVIFTRSVELSKAVPPVPPTLTRTCTVPPEM